MPRFMSLLTAASFTFIGSVSFMSCKKQNLSSTKNFIKDDGSAIIFSVSQNEAEMGRLRLCVDPYGNPLGQKADVILKPGQTSTATKCEAAVAKAMGSALPTFTDPDSGPASGILTSNPSQEQEPSAVGDAINSGIESGDFSSTSQESDFSSSQTPLSLVGDAADINVTIEKKEVKDVIHTFFSGNHLAPRCWYRWDRKDPKDQPGFSSPAGRARTAAQSLRLTKYSISSTDIVTSMMADSNLQDLKLVVRNADALKAKQFNDNLTEVEQNQLFQTLKTFIGTSALTLSVSQLGNFSDALAVGTTEGLRKGSNMLIQSQIRMMRNSTAKPAEQAKFANNLVKQSLQKEVAIRADLKEISELVSQTGKKDELQFALGNTMARLRARLAAKARLDDVLLANAPEVDDLMKQIADISENKTAEGAKALAELVEKAFKSGSFVTLENFKTKAVYKPTSNIVKETLEAITKPAVLDEVATHISKFIAGGYRLCQGGPAQMGKIACISLIGVGMSELTKWGLSTITDIGFRAPTVQEMNEADLTLAANMFSSSKINLEITDTEFELLANIDNETANSNKSIGLNPKTWFTDRSTKAKNIGFIPIIGDNPSQSGVVCPTSNVMAKILQQSELNSREFEALKKLMEESGFTSKPVASQDSALATPEATGTNP